MKVYKFRSLDNCTDLARIGAILRTGKLWHSRFCDMNDPMEGVYYASGQPEIVREVFSEKAKLAVCCFSGKKALKSPLMWGYYASGFRGVAIELEVDSSVVKIRYADKPSSSIEQDSALGRAKSILSSKLRPWKHEHEYRSIVGDGSGEYCVGVITGVILGDPYPETLANHAEVHSRSATLQHYAARLRSLKQVIEGRADIKVMTAALGESGVEVKVRDE